MARIRSSTDTTGRYKLEVQAQDSRNGQAEVLVGEPGEEIERQATGGRQRAVPGVGQQPLVAGPVPVGGVGAVGSGRAGDRDGELLYSHLIEAAPGGSPTGTLSVAETQWGGVGVEDLSYWPSQDAIWTVTEYPGRRAIYSCPRVAPPDRAGEVRGTVD